MYVLKCFKLIDIIRKFLIFSQRKEFVYIINYTQNDKDNKVDNKVDNNDNNNDNNNNIDINRIYAYMHSGEALNRRELGRASWAYLHTLANYYPEKPSSEHQKEMLELIWLYMKYYPCGYCSDMTIQEMYRNPPKLKNRKEFSEWMCQIHNEVNSRLGKPIFDCKNTSKRWRI